MEPGRSTSFSVTHPVDSSAGCPTPLTIPDSRRPAGRRWKGRFTARSSGSRPRKRSDSLSGPTPRWKSPGQSVAADRSFVPRRIRFAAAPRAEGSEHVGIEALIEKSDVAIGKRRERAAEVGATDAQVFLRVDERSDLVDDVCPPGPWEVLGTARLPLGRVAPVDRFGDQKRRAQAIEHL